MQGNRGLFHQRRADLIEYIRRAGCDQALVRSDFKSEECAAYSGAKRSSQSQDESLCKRGKGTKRGTNSLRTIKSLHETVFGCHNGINIYQFNDGLFPMSLSIGYPGFFQRRPEPGAHLRPVPHTTRPSRHQPVPGRRLSRTQPDYLRSKVRGDQS